MTPGVALIIPVGPGDDSWRRLGTFLKQLPEGMEQVLVGCEPSPQDWPPGFEHVRWIEADRGRAAQCNAGAEATQAEFLWWLHADSEPASDAWQALLAALRARPDALHWFRLRFSDGPRLGWLNAAGANWRSRRFGLPFGDQGLCLARASFRALGGFDRTLALGEDLALVMRAQRDGIALNEVAATISTSARRYARQGWLRTTLRHLWLTWRLARAERARWVAQA